MTILSEILDFNKEFVDAKEYGELRTDKYPSREIAILTCMDARIVELLPKAMGIKNGDAKIIKNAGALVSHPWGAVMRSLIVAALEFNVKEILVIGHTDCGMRGFEPQHLLDKAMKCGIKEETITTLRNAGIDLDGWLRGFDNVADSVRYTVEKVKNHPLMPQHVAIHGLVMHPTTGKLHTVVDGYKNETNPNIPDLLQSYQKEGTVPCCCSGDHLEDCSVSELELSDAVDPNKSAVAAEIESATKKA